MINTMTLQEAAGILKVQPRTIRIWISKGKIDAYRAGKKYLLSIADVENLVAKAGFGEANIRQISRLKSAFAGGMPNKAAVRSDIDFELAYENAANRSARP